MGRLNNTEGCGLLGAEPADTPKTTAPPEDGARNQCMRSCAYACVQKDGAWNCPDQDPTAKNPKPKNPETPTTSSAEELAQKCIDNNSDAVNSCTSSQSSADNNCNADKNAGVGGATDLAAALALAMGQMTSSGIQSACSNMAGLSQGSNAALATYRANCNSAKNSCTNSCSSAKSKVDQCAKNSANSSDVQKALANNGAYQSMNSAASKCKALQTKVDQADQAIKNMVTTQQNAQNCQQATAAMSTVPALQDCTNPTFAATNQVCICQANPRGPGCGLDQTSLASPEGLSPTGYSDSGATAAADADLPGLQNDMNLSELKAQQAAAEDVGGKQGAPAPISSASAFNGGDNRPHARRTNDYDKYAGTSGFYGAGTGGGGGTYGGSRTTGSGSGSTANSGFYKSDRPDLRQFLPGGSRDPHRGIAGTTGPDGITGPNTSIWEKVQNRYRNVTPSLL